MELGQATKLTVYVHDSARHGRGSLYRAIVHVLHDAGLAGATVLHGIEGYGADQRIHTARILDLSSDLPVVIVAIDRHDKIQAVIPTLDAMIEKGLVTTERVEVVVSNFPRSTG